MSEAFTGHSGPTFSFADANLETIDFMQASYLVGVSGITKYGHGLLRVRNYYFHVDQAWGIYPKWMSHTEYTTRYIPENKKTEWFQFRIPDITNPIGALQELKRRLKTTYIWTPALNNCVSFAEYIFEAGGSKYTGPNMPSNVRDSLPKLQAQNSTPMLH